MDVKGWINIQKYPKQGKYKGGYCTGGDIHDTEEVARKVASPLTIATIPISFIDKKAE